MIIDVHTHAFSEKIAAKAMASLAATAGKAPCTDGTVKGVLDCMDRLGVDKSVVLTIATKPTQHKIVNNWATEIKSERILPFGSVHPDGEDALETLEYIKKSGLYGIKLHPDYQNFFADDPKAYPIYDLCSQLELPVIFHAGFDPLCPEVVHGTPMAYSKIHREFPGLKMILAHLGGMYRWEQVERHIAGLDGEIYLDTAFTAGEIGSSILDRIIKKHGTDRILMASDCPWDDPANEIKMIQQLNIPDSDKDKLLYKNAVRLLGIDT